jgi:hypothetical protein
MCPRRTQSTPIEQLHHASSAGIVKAQVLELRTKKYLLPFELRAPDGKTGFSISQQDVRITLSMTGKELVLTPHGFYIGGSQGKMLSYTKNSLGEMARLIRQDTELQKSFFSLQSATSGAIASLVGHVTHQNLPYVLPDGIQQVMVRSSTSRVKAYAAIPSLPTGPGPRRAGTRLMFRNPGALICTTQTLVDIQERRIEHWSKQVISAVEQLAACEKRCLKQYGPGGTPFTSTFKPGDPIQLLRCTAGCVAAGFEDIVTETLDFIEVETYEKTRYITTCLPSWEEPILAVLQSPTRQPDNQQAFQNLVADAKRMLAPLKKVMECLLKGQWGVDNLSDLPLGDKWYQRCPKIPIAVRICVDHNCATAIRDFLFDTASAAALTAIEAGLGILVTQGVLAAALAELLGATALMALATTVAGAIGLTAPEVLILVGIFAISVALEAAIIAGQIALFDKGKGVCLHKTPIPVPIPGPNVLVPIPTIVTPS